MVLQISGPYKIKMLVNSAPIWVTSPNSSVELAATESILLNFTVRARPAATFSFSFQKTDGSIVKIGFSGLYLLNLYLIRFVFTQFTIIGLHFIFLKSLQYKVFV